MITITSYRHPDIDAIACMFAYSELLSHTEPLVSYKIYGNPHTEATYILEKYMIPLKSSMTAIGKSVVLVDMSDSKMIPDPSILLGDIIEVIDHRTYGDRDPFVHAKIQIETVGSCATLIAERFFTSALTPTGHAAILLQAAIYSNTLNFKNNLTTQRDIDAFHRLREIYVVPDEVLQGMFLEKSNIKADEGLLDLYEKNSKVFYYGKTSVRIVQIEMMDARKFTTAHITEISGSYQAYADMIQEDILVISFVDLSGGGNSIFTDHIPLRDYIQMEFTPSEKIGEWVYTEQTYMRKEIAPRIAPYFGSLGLLTL